eukprot:g41673.t1
MFFCLGPSPFAQCLQAMVPPVTVMILTLDCLCIFASYCTTRTPRDYMIWSSCIHGGGWVTLVIWSTELRGSLTREEDQDVAESDEQLLDEFANADLENMATGEESDNEAKRAYQAFLVAQRNAFDLYNQIQERIMGKQKSTTYAFLQQCLFGDEQKHSQDWLKVKHQLQFLYHRYQHECLQCDQNLCKQKRHACKLHFFSCVTG